MKAELTEKTRKQFNKLPKIEQRKITKKLLLLSTSPLLGKMLSGEFAGIFSLRAWPYRILYIFEKEQKKITIITIEHRQGSYR